MGGLSSGCFVSEVGKKGLKPAIKALESSIAVIVNARSVDEVDAQLAAIEAATKMLRSKVEATKYRPGGPTF